MTEKVCIFHHPFPVTAEGKSGSQVRPYRMLEAFKALGYEVESITGYAKERQQGVHKLLKDLAAGRHFDFVYSESLAIPTLLSEPHHMPTHPHLDFGFLAQLKRAGVPIGLFYRDIYWRFEEYVHTPLKQRIVSLPFHYYDWWQYRRLVNVLFLPSLEMARHLPVAWPSSQLAALPPGVPLHSEKINRPSGSRDKLELFYVGGVNPPIYDLTVTFDMLRATQEAHLTLCCREAEWRTWQHHYHVPENVTIVHVSGEALAEPYAKADAFIILRRPNPYLEFAMPIKLFEALGNTLPLITTSGNSGGNFVEANGLGWTVATSNDFSSLIGELLKNPFLLERMRQHVVDRSKQHSWQARAQYVTQVMAAYKAKAVTDRSAGPAA